MECGSKQQAVIGGSVCYVNVYSNKVGQEQVVYVA